MDTRNVFRIIKSSKAQKYIRGQDKDSRKRIVATIKDIAKDPYKNNDGKMKGLKNHWKKRIGGYRIIFRIKAESSIVEIVKIGPRSDIYKK